MTMVNTATVKQPFKLIQIPLSKFRDEAIPHHKGIFEVHKKNVEKNISCNNAKQVQWEIKDKKRIVRQLKDLMYELDTLRAQVEDSDLAKFDLETLSLRKTILDLISNYTSLENEASNFITTYTEENSKHHDAEQEIAQIQVVDDLSELRLKDKERQFQHVEALHKDIEDVHGIFAELNQFVGTQAEQVTSVEKNTESTSLNLKEGLKQLIQASKLKKASYPVAGAFIGTAVGGPVGCVAGLKIGGLTAIGCGIIGYFSGRFIKKPDEEQISPELVDSNILSGNENPGVTIIEEKKDM